MADMESFRKSLPAMTVPEADDRHELNLPKRYLWYPSVMGEVLVSTSTYEEIIDKSRAAAQSLALDKD